MSEENSIEYERPISKYIAIEPLSNNKLDESKLESIHKISSERLAEVILPMLEKREGEIHTIEIREEYIDLEHEYAFGYRALITLSSKEGDSSANELLEKRGKIS